MKFPNTFHPYRSGSRACEQNNFVAIVAAHPSGRLEKILEMISSQTFYLPPSLLVPFNWRDSPSQTDLSSSQGDEKVMESTNIHLSVRNIYPPPSLTHIVQTKQETFYPPVWCALPDKQMQIWSWRHMWTRNNTDEPDWKILTQLHCATTFQLCSITGCCWCIQYYFVTNKGIWNMKNRMKK